SLFGELFERVAGDRIPAPDGAVGATGQQGAVVGEERRGPDRQPGSSQRAPRSMMATEPRMPAAAISVPSPDTAMVTIVFCPLSISPRGTPSRDKKNTRPSAPPTTISPSPVTATALSGVGRVATSGAPPSSGQIRKVRS